MYGATVLYYIYLVILVILVIVAFSGVATGAYAGGIIGGVLALLIALPGLLFTGWIAFVLGKCRNTIELAAKMTNTPTEIRN
jgi:hypothetical protein